MWRGSRTTATAATPWRRNRPGTTRPSCGIRRPFDPSGRFRANTNGKLVDIWSIYRCRACDATKNVTIAERTPVRRVPPALLRAAEENDPVLARAYARDVGLLKRNGMRVVDGDEWEVDGHAGAGAVTLAFVEPLLVRLDAVAAAALRVPRRDVMIDSVPTRVDALRLWCGEVVVRRT